ncbi:MAG: M48 family metallopeptidase [Candidatus Omnitrophota bacterium]
MTGIWQSKFVRLVVVSSIFCFLSGCETVSSNNVTQEEKKAMISELNAERTVYSQKNLKRVSTVGNRLLINVPDEAKHIKFSTEGKISGINAYADLNGDVVVTPEMLCFVRDDSELAAVLAHELAHIVKRHPLQTIGNRVVGKAAGMMIGSLAEKYAPGAGNSIAAYSSAVVSSPYSKEMEMAADAASLVYMQRAGFDVDAALRVWRRFSIEIPATRQNSIMATHPSSDERLAALTSLIAKMKGETSLENPK